MATETRYESTFIIKGTLDDETHNTLVTKAEETVKKNGGTLIETERWGRRKLAYPIERETTGLYVSLHFTASGAAVAKLERMYQLDESIIRWLTLVMPEENHQLRKKMKKRVEDVAARRALEAANALQAEQAAASGKIRVHKEEIPEEVEA